MLAVTPEAAREGEIRRCRFCVDPLKGQRAVVSPGTARCPGGSSLHSSPREADADGKPPELPQPLSLLLALVAKACSPSYHSTDTGVR